MGAILLVVNIARALVEAVPVMAKALVDVRQAFKETARAGKKHVRKAVGAGRRKYEVRRGKYERTKRR